MKNWSKLHRAITTGTLFVAGMLPAGAQSISTERSVIAGGGGTSIGGAFTLSGTIGQPDATTPLTGGAFSLAGGFWALPVAIQMPGAPLLSVGLSNSLVVVSWPRAGAEGFVLDSATSLAAVPANTVWAQVLFPYQTNATHIFITTAPFGAGFYRLRRP